MFQNYSLVKNSVNDTSFPQNTNKKILSFNFSRDVFPPSCKPFIWHSKMQEPAANPAITDLSTVHFQTRKLLRQNFIKSLAWG